MLCWACDRDNSKKLIRMPLDSLRQAPQYLAPKAQRPEVLVDQYRDMLMDPTDNSIVGMPGPMGAQGNLGRLQYAARSPSNRSY